MSTKTSSSPTAAQRPGAARTFFVSGLGTAMEYYDFSIYGLAAALVFPTVFFPDLDPLVGSLVAFAAFGVGFIARPLGGIVIGHFGDRLGRRPVLVLTLVVMGVSTFLIGCLPGHAVLGSGAAAVLVLLRLVQGFAAGGEWGGASVIGIEGAPPGRRGLWGSFTSMGIGLGTLLGTVAFTIVSAVAGGAIADFGWRVPFWLGGLLVVIGLIARLRLPQEEPSAKGDGPRVPALEAIRSHPRQVAGAIAVSFGWNTIAYVISVFFLAYVASNGYDNTASLSFQILSSGALVIAALVFGRLSDRLGRRPVMIVGGLVLAALFFAFFPLAQLQVPGLTAITFFVIGFVSGAPQGPLPALLGEQFPLSIRYSGISLTYQIGAAIGGGTAASIATTLLIWSGGDPLGVSAYAAAATGVLIVGVLLLRETAHASADELGLGRATAATQA